MMTVSLESIRSPHEFPRNKLMDLTAPNPP